MPIRSTSLRELNAAVQSGAFLFALTAAAATDNPPRKTTGQPATIPFVLLRDQIVVEVEVAPGQALPFIFDSGLSVGNVLTIETAEALDLKPEGRARYGDTSGGVGSALVTTIPRIRVGNAVLGEQKYAVTSVPEQLTQRDGKPSIAGFLGAPLMQDAVLCIDYRHRQMQRWAREAFRDTGYAAIPMILNHGLPVITVTVDGRPAAMIVDSGNNGGVEFFPAYAEKNDLRKRYPQLETLDGVSGGGGTFEVLGGTAESVEISPGSVLQKVPLSLVPQAMNPEWGIDGLAGYAVLSRLNPCLDRDGGRLLWKAKETVRN